MNIVGCVLIIGASPARKAPVRKTNTRREATRQLENNMNGLFDAIGSIIDNPAFCEWMGKFCEDCPAITRIPATRYTPATEYCPCDFQPFINGGCERESEINGIEIAAENLDELMKEAVA